MPKEQAEATTKPPAPTPRKNAGGGAPALQTAPAQSYSQDTHRVVPHSIEAEKAVLSSMLQAPSECIGQAMEGKLFPELFYNEGRQILYRTIVELYDEGKPADPIAMTDLLRDRRQLDLIGGPSELAEILTFVASAADFGYYSGKLKDKYILRQVISASNANISKAYDDVPSVTDLLDGFERDVLAIREGMESEGGIQGIQHYLMEAIQQIQDMFDNPGKVSGIQTGFRDFDKKTQGLQGGQMIVIAARPSMGKTSLAMNIVENVSLKSKIPVAVFSLEMTSQQLVQRMLCSQASIPMHKMLGGLLSEKRDFSKLQRAAGQLAEAKVFIDDTPSLSIMALRAKARRLKKQHDIGLIAIDYLQLLRSESKRAQDNRQQEVSEISSGVKALAKELNVPIIVLAQLNRSPETRSGSNRPMLSDLRESGSIEQDADLVGLLMRDAYYAQSEQEKEELAGKATLIIAKQRNGATGDVHLTFREELMRFETAAHVDDNAEG